MSLFLVNDCCRQSLTQMALHGHSIIVTGSACCDRVAFGHGDEIK